MEFDFLVKSDEPAPIIGATSEPPSLNKFTPKKFMSDVGKAYEELGGLSWLISQAQCSPQEFMKILQKIIPKQVDLDLMEGLNIRLIDQFGRSIELSAGQPASPPTPVLKSAHPLPSKLPKQPHAREGGQTATSGNPDIEIKDMF